MLERLVTAGLLVCLGTACGGKIESSDPAPNGGSGGSGGSGGAVAPPSSGGDECAVLSSGDCYSCEAARQERARRNAAPANNEPAIAAARAALAGGFRVKEIHIGGYEPGQSPDNYRERLIGADFKICFRDATRVTVCECAQLLLAAVNEIRPGDHPTDQCVAPSTCTDHVYSFDASGLLRIDVPEGSLVWPLRPSKPYGYGAGTVTVRPEGTYVNSLIGLGNALLEPTTSCP